MYFLHMFIVVSTGAVESWVDVHKYFDGKENWPFCISEMICKKNLSINRRQAGAISGVLNPIIKSNASSIGC